MKTTRTYYLQLFYVIYKATACSTHCICRAKNYWISKFVCNCKRFINCIGNLTSCPADPVLREQIMLASMQAGLAFSNAILGAVHAMSHSLGGFLDLPHGLCNALLLEHVVAYNFPSTEDRFRRVAEAMDIDTRGMSNAHVKKRLMERIVLLKRKVGLEARLKELGVTSSDIPYLSGYALKDPCILTNPRKSSLRDVQVVYEEAL